MNLLEPMDLKKEKELEPPSNTDKPVLSLSYHHPIKRFISHFFYMPPKAHDNTPRPAIEESLKEYLSWLKMQPSAVQSEELAKLSESTNCTITLNKPLDEQIFRK